MTLRSSRADLRSFSAASLRGLSTRSTSAPVSVSGESATYRLKPGRLTTHWINEKGQYKVQDIGFKVSWWWVLRNWRFVRDMRRKMKERQAATPVV